MGIPRTILGAGLLVVLAACGSHESDNVTVVTISGSQSSGRTAGGGIVRVKGSALTVEGGAWIFDDPKEFRGRVPPASLVAIGDALFRAGPDTEIMDAVKTARGTVALIRTADGRTLLYHFADEVSAWSLAPSGARRVLSGARDPLTVRVLVADDLVVRATRAGE
jgi:hypothetical protein